MPTPDVFDFDSERLTGYSQDVIDRALVEQPALYVNHLRVARHLRQWASGMLDSPSVNKDFREGYSRALREVAAHLRQADYVEGGLLIINQPAEEPTFGDED